MRSLTRFSVLFVGAVCFTACGDSGRSVDFPVPDDTPVSELTVTDMQQICLQALTQVQGATYDLQCIIAGLSAKYSGEGTCEEARSSCLAENAGELSEIEQSCYEIDESSLGDLQSCDVTVGEYERCVNAALAVLDAVFGQVNCSSTPEQLQGLGEPDLPAECVVLEQKCSALGLGDDDTVSDI